MFKNIINKILSIVNLKIIKLNRAVPFNLTNKNLDPITAQYLIGQSQMVINIELSKGRTNNWFDMSKKSLDPAIFSIRKALNKGFNSENLYDEILSSLKEHRSLTTCKNAAEFLDIDLEESENLKKYPWWAEVYPWDSYTFDDEIRDYPNDVKRNRARNGMHISSNDPDEIIRVDFENSLPSHAKQYLELVKKIRDNGFKFGGNYGYVTAEILIANNEMRWKPGRDGNHRVAVASALDYKTIPVLVTKIIRLEEIEYWPNVRRELFTKAQAKKIFYNIFDANPSKFHNSWIKKNCLSNIYG
tara:strand:- start:2285 stop:3187 length:903 start_codon:yes stop_codon:yes gene_type:complete